jgi:hypothetical protein
MTDTDPTIRDCALQLIEETRAKVEMAYLARHVPTYILREEILYREVPGWIKMYGKPTADLAVRALNSMSHAQFMTRFGREQSRIWMKSQLREGLKTRGRNSWLNRVWLNLFGLPLYGIAFTVGLGALLAPSTGEARHEGRRDLLHACAAAEPARRHGMGCWRFSPSELAISRPWDDPPARPDWDNKRPWEREIDE